MAVSWTFPSLVLALLAAPAAAQEVLVREPRGPVEPGSIRVAGHVVGGEGLSLTCDGKPVALQEEGYWEVFVDVGLGWKRLRFELSDETGLREVVQHDVIATGESTGFRPRRTLLATTAEELVAAIGSNRTILLEPGDYVLNRVLPGAAGEGVVRKPVTGNVAVEDVLDLEIVGSAEGRSRIVNDHPSGTTLILDRGEEVRLTALDLVHRASEDVDAPQGGVVLLVRGTHKTWIRGCTLTGVGVGLQMLKTNGLVLVDSAVEDCTGGAIRTKNTKHVTFLRSRISGNGRGAEGDVCVSLEGRERRDIDFIECEVRGNRPGPGVGLFHLEAAPTLIYFLDGVIQDNEAAALSSGEGADRFEPRDSRVQRFE